MANVSDKHGSDGCHGNYIRSARDRREGGQENKGRRGGGGEEVECEVKNKRRGRGSSGGGGGWGGVMKKVEIVMEGWRERGGD